MAIFGKNVRGLRLAAALAQEELAVRAGLKRSYLSDIERCTRNSSVGALGRIAEALQVEPAALLAIYHANRHGGK